MASKTVEMPRHSMCGTNCMVRFLSCLKQITTVINIFVFSVVLALQYNVYARAGNKFGYRGKPRLHEKASRLPPCWTQFFQILQRCNYRAVTKLHAHIIAFYLVYAHLLW